jgi:dipeptidyl aminopeptidase/acylaminoacyl peptidase
MRSAIRATGPGDAELVVEVGANGVRTSVWSPATDEVRRIPGLEGNILHPLLSPDARSVLVHVDDNGSEVGHVCAYGVDGEPPVDLTPDLAPYGLRGLGTDRAGRVIVLTTSDDDGYSLVSVGEDGPRVLYHSTSEAWYGLVSADGTVASLNTTDHNPGVRRFGLTVIDVASGERLAFLSDGETAPVTGVQFSPTAGDQRILATTERSGFARPVIWDPISGARVDVDAPHLAGELIALDWSDDGGYVLVIHVDAGVHRVYEYALATHQLRPLSHPDGAYFEPDVSSPRPLIWASHYGPGAEIRLLRQRFDRPLEILRLNRSSADITVWPQGGPVDESSGPLRSVIVDSLDGTPVQLWVATPPDAEGPVPFVVWIHGGPNLVSIDEYNPRGMAWLEEGFGYAAVNYRGSVTFGRRFREGFWGAPGEGELEDIEACVRRLVAEGLAREDAVFISGESYGGFLTLLSLGKRPGLFAGGLAFVALADWALAYEDMHASLRLPWKHFLGETPELEVVHRRRSPLTYARNVRAPLLMSQATSDTRTTPRQAAEYVRRLRDWGGDVLLTWFDGGHETSSTTSLVHDQEMVIELARRALRGERWDQYEPH